MSKEEEVKQENLTGLIVFHKHIKDSDWSGKMSEPMKIIVPSEDIRTITQSHTDGTTLVRTNDGGIIAVEESIDDATKLWSQAREEALKKTAELKK